MVEQIAVIAGVVLLVLNQFGLLDWMKPKSASDVAAELELADRQAERREQKVAELNRENAELKLQRTNEPVIEVIGQVAEIASQTLTKLAAFNGSLKHINEGLGETRDGLRDAVQAMQTMSAVIAETYEISLDGHRGPNLIRKETP